jgi:branched-chain amino acid transport system substrate-binding protein
VIAPLTGSSAHLADVVDGMNFAADKLNRWGGLNGARIEVVVRDSTSDPNRSIELFEDLERNERPMVYVSAACSCTRPLIPLSEESQVPLIGIATANALGFEQSNWSFRYYPGMDEEIAPVLSMLESLGASSLGIMRSDNVMGEELTAHLSDALNGTGVAVEVVDYCCKDGDIPGKVANISDCDAIYIAADFKATQAGLVAVREAGYAGHVFGSSAASSPGVTTMPEAQGMYVSAPAIYNPNYLPAKQLTAEFLEAFGHNMTHYAASGYDVMYLIYGLMKDRDLTREEMRAQLHGGFSYASILGPISVLAGTHDIQYDLFRAQVVEGGLWYL